MDAEETSTMTLTDARKILERFKPDSQLVKEAIDLALSQLPVPESPPEIDKRFNELKIAIKVAKDGYDPFEDRSRDVTNVTWRGCVFYQMRNEGYSYSQIGKISGYNHSTIIWSYNHFRQYLEINDHNTIKIWNEFLKYINHKQ